MRDVRNGKLKLFPDVNKGPRQRRTSVEIQEEIFNYRKKRYSSPQIHKQLSETGITVSVKTIERILADAGFGKLKRRTFKELGITSKNKIIPESSAQIDFAKLKPFNIDCPAAGVFFFLPYIIESGIIDIAENCNLPESSCTCSVQACLSMLLLKLIGNERLSQMDAYDKEPGLGIFAGLNILPESTFMSTYSCRTSEAMLLEFQEKLIKQFIDIYPHIYDGQFINLDFHSIPHFGEESEMEKVWCGSRGKAMKGANTIFAQDSRSNTIIYTRADITGKEEAEEIKKFIAFWKRVKGDVDETVVFDCNFTKYKLLDEMTEEGIKFITLRKRSRKLISDTSNIPKELWTKVNIPIPKRKYSKVSVYQDNNIVLRNCKNRFRQIIIKDNGRPKPTYIITNDKDLSISKILEVYAKRWHIENKIAKMVSFFNLNALSSPLMIRIHFDLLWTMIADTLYHRFAQDLRRFENNKASTIFKKFINMPGRVVYDGEKFIIKIRKRSHTPILLGVEKINKPFAVPWLNNTTIEIVWTP